MLSGLELNEALSVLEEGEEGALWAGATGAGAGLVRALLAAGGARAAAVLAAAPDSAARALLEQLQDALRHTSPASSRHHALATVAPLVALRPAWLQRVPAGALTALAAALARCARHERAALPLLHALLALAALVASAPAAAAPPAPALWAELPAALLRPAALAPPPQPVAAAHLQLAQLALFHSLYATHPCTLVEALRGELAAPAARAAFDRDLAPLVRTARLQPALLSGSRQREADGGRWARAELHDVLADAHALSTPPPAPPDTPPPLDEPAPPEEPAPGSAAWAARNVPLLRPGSEGWFAPSEVATGQPAPVTPVPQPEPEPEAAVEATPENTPARDARTAFRFPGGDSSAVRAIGRRSPRAEPSPPLEGAAAAGGRLARVLSERRALESPVPFGAGAPPGVARPEPRPPEPLEAPWEPTPDAAPLTLLATLSPSARLPRPRAPPPPRPAPPRRARSLPPSGAPRRSVSTQTSDRWPQPYEFLIADFYSSLPADNTPQRGACSDQLEEYLCALVTGQQRGEGGGEELLALTQAALMFEQWRRRAHAERNRRLLGRVRAARDSELHAAQLRARHHDLVRERDELRARLAAQRPAHCGPSGEREQRLERALHEERAARARAEARLLEAEAARGHQEDQCVDTTSGEDDQHLQALARAAASSGQRARHVRRLQQQLLVLGEQQQRLHAVAEQQRAPPPLAADERALRAGALRAETELAAAVARADALAARVQQLETALSSREAALCSQRRAARAAGAEWAARAAAMSDKYCALVRVVRRGEERALALRAEGELAAPPLPAQPPPRPDTPPPPAHHS